MITLTFEAENVPDLLAQMRALVGFEVGHMPPAAVTTLAEAVAREFTHTSADTPPAPKRGRPRKTEAAEPVPDQPAPESQPAAPAADPALEPPAFLDRRDENVGEVSLSTLRETMEQLLTAKGANPVVDIVMKFKTKDGVSCKKISDIAEGDRAAALGLAKQALAGK